MYTTSPSDIQRFLTDAVRPVALDTETTGLDPRAEGFRVTHLSAADAEGRALVLPGVAVELGRELLRGLAPMTPWAHNAAFDYMAILRHYGLRLDCLRDSIPATLAVDPDAHRTGLSLKALRPATEDALEDLRRRWATHQGAPAEKLRGKAWLSEAVVDLPPNDRALVAYSAIDSVECAKLVGSLAGTAHREPLRTEVEASRVWGYRRAAGLRVDEGALHEYQRRIEGLSAESVAEHGIDLSRTTNAVRAWVLDHGIRITDRDGRATLSEKCYDRAEVSEGCEEHWETFLAARELAGEKNKVAELLRTVRAGRVYPDVATFGTVTGRMAIRRPALQNLSPALREVLLADEGTVLVGCDLDHVEPCVAAILSGDEAMKTAVAADVYTDLAVRIWGEGFRGDKARRRVAKTALLATLYGQGIASLAERLGVERDEAEEIKNSMFAAYPDLQRWIRRTQREARDGARQHTVTGRPLPLDTGAPYRLVNYAVQGSAADLFKACVSRTAAALGTETLWLPVHDELVVQVPEDQAEAAAAALGDAMTDDIEGVRIGGEPEIIGPRWKK